MQVQSDVYVKFGYEVAGDNRDEIWDLTGDSTDATHLWWHEVRSCDFGVERKNSGKAGDAGEGVAQKGGKKELDPVTLKKRVDWGSAPLFKKCCAAAMEDAGKKGKRLPDPQIKKVRVEICRTAGGVKFPYIIIEYSGVRVLSYDVTMDGPEAVETLRLKVDDFRYGFRPTSPYTGEPLTKYTPEQDYEQPNDAGVIWADTRNWSDDSGGDSSKQQEDDTGSVVQEGAAQAAAAAGIATVAAGAAKGNGALPALASATDGAVKSNFPGLWDQEGFGLLPD